jgi:hypothetical protein
MEVRFAWKMDDERIDGRRKIALERPREDHFVRKTADARKMEEKATKRPMDDRFARTMPPCLLFLMNFSFVLKSDWTLV